jgi:hypothetical protein
MRFGVVILVAWFLVGCDRIATSEVQVQTQEADAAVKIVGRIVGQCGLHDVRSSPDAEADEIHSWGLTTEQEQAKRRGPLTCTVYLRDGLLRVLFCEFGRGSSSSDVKSMTVEIRSAFADHFGSERVR